MPVSTVELSVIAAWPRLSILCCVLAFHLLAGPGTARAQQEVAPGYDAAAFVGALYSHAQAPKAEQFASAAAALVGAIDAWCREPGETAPAVAGATDDAGDADLQPAAPLGAARAAWMAAADAWARLAAVSLGATLERNSAASLDARPTRPPQIRAAIAARGRSRQPPDEKALGRVGATAKGLPALEWLLWDRSAPHSAAACRYATGLSQEVEREAGKLAAAHGEDAAAEWKDKESEAVARATEAVTQWLAGLERLRSHQLGEPLTVAAGKAGAALDATLDTWPRPASGSHRGAWQSGWESLRQLAIGPALPIESGAQPAVATDVISLEALLRGIGRDIDADAWAKSVMAADQVVEALTSAASAPARGPAHEATALPPAAVMERAVQALGAVKDFLMATVTPALQGVLGPGKEDDAPLGATSVAAGPACCGPVKAQ